jgi:hypothetical protein
VIYGSKDWKLSRICFPYEPEERADIDPAREWIGQGGIILLAGVGERPKKNEVESYSEF